MVLGYWGAGVSESVIRSGGDQQTELRGKESKLASLSSTKQASEHSKSSCMLNPLCGCSTWVTLERKHQPGLLEFCLGTPGKPSVHMILWTQGWSMQMLPGSPPTTE